MLFFGSDGAKCAQALELISKKDGVGSVPEAVDQAVLFMEQEKLDEPPENLFFTIGDVLRQQNSLEASMHCYKRVCLFLKEGGKEHSWEYAVASRSCGEVAIQIGDKAGGKKWLLECIALRTGYGLRVAEGSHMFFPYCHRRRKG